MPSSHSAAGSSAVWLQRGEREEEQGGRSGLCRKEGERKMMGQIQEPKSTHFLQWLNNEVKSVTTTHAKISLSAIKATPEITEKNAPGMKAKKMKNEKR